MEKKILVYDDNGTESEEFCTILAQLSSQTVKVNTRAQTPPLPSFTTSSLTAIRAVTNVNTCDHIDHIHIYTGGNYISISISFITADSDNCICASIFFSFSDTGLRDIANGHWNLYRYGLYGRFFYGKKKKKGYSYRR